MTEPREPQYAHTLDTLLKPFSSDANSGEPAIRIRFIDTLPREKNVIRHPEDSSPIADFVERVGINEFADYYFKSGDPSNSLSDQSAVRMGLIWGLRRLLGTAARFDSRLPGAEFHPMIPRRGLGYVNQVPPKFAKEISDLSDLEESLLEEIQPTPAAPERG